MTELLRRLRIDPFTLFLLATVAAASVFPVAGAAADGLALVTKLAIGFMFFLYGARLSRAAVVGGLTRWRLHLTVLASTFLLFPVLGLALGALAPGLLSPELQLGLLYLCTLPSTVQASIAFTSIAGGNVPAAICSASASNLIGILVTPLLVGLLMHAQGAGPSAAQLGQIMAQLLLPFLAGQLARPWIGGWAQRHRAVLSLTDRGSILLVVYGAFSEAVVGGIWQRTAPGSLAAMALADGVLLAAVLAITTGASRLFGFAREDEIVAVFCGSKKSLASGVPMANVLFAGPAVGLIVLPLMLFHQIQLIACAVLARRYAARAPAAKLGFA